jgi:hypothetical protein
VIIGALLGMLLAALWTYWGWGEPPVMPGAAEGEVAAGPAPLAT